MKKYYDLEEDLVGVIDKYENKYKLYIERMHKKGSSSLLES